MRVRWSLGLFIRWSVGLSHQKKILRIVLLAVLRLAKTEALETDISRVQRENKATDAIVASLPFFIRMQ